MMVIINQHPILYSILFFIIAIWCVYVILIPINIMSMRNTLDDIKKILIEMNNKKGE